MGELGFLGCTIPDYDLPGVSSVAYGMFSYIKREYRFDKQRSGSYR